MSELLPSQPPSTNRTGAVIVGVILIGIGTIFLLQNFGWFYFNNWWALFILLGTAGAWSNAWNIYQKNGRRITQRVIGAFMGGIFPLVITLIFLFDLDWGTIWPVFLITAGLAVLCRSFGVPDKT
jgi:hypothetical protein